MGLLRTLAVGLELACLGIFRTEVSGDEFLRRAECQGREVRGVCSHVGDETALVETLGHPHRHTYRETQLPCGLLLESRCRERGCREACGLFLLHIGDREVRSDAVLEEFPRLVDCLELCVEDGLDLDRRRESGRMEECLDLVECLVLERHDLLFPLHHKPQGHGLHTTRRKLRLDLSPKDR